MTDTGHSPDSRSDESLLGAMALDDEAAGIAFVRRYQRRVFGMAFGILGDSGLAEDVAQEALIRVWRHAPVYDVRRGSVTSWVLTITRNLAIDALRLRRAVPFDPEDLIALGAASREMGPEDAAQQADVLAKVYRALQEIPFEQRRALFLSAYYGMSGEEIAVIESIPLGTAKTRVRAALTKVRAAVVVAAETGRPPVVGQDHNG
ncbi:MAG: RNA polymerase sigma factor [Acidimicrobiales bacterium]